MINITCETCGRHLMKAYGTVIATIACPNSKCKATNNVKRVSNNPALDIRFKFADETAKAKLTSEQKQ